MSEDFSGQNLQGRSFKGQTLKDANFSNADIRGANFSKALLSGANFANAKVGMRSLWLIIAIEISLAIAASILCYFAGTTKAAIAVAIHQNTKDLAEFLTIFAGAMPALLGTVIFKTGILLTRSIAKTLHLRTSRITSFVRFGSILNWLTLAIIVLALKDIYSIYFDFIEPSTPRSGSPGGASMLEFSFSPYAEMTAGIGAVWLGVIGGTSMASRIKLLYENTKKKKTLSDETILGAIFGSILGVTAGSLWWYLASWVVLIGVVIMFLPVVFVGGAADLLGYIVTILPGILLGISAVVIGEFPIVFPPVVFAIALAIGGIFHSFFYEKYFDFSASIINGIAICILIAFVMSYAISYATRHTSFYRADLTNANFTGATIDYADFTDIKV